MVVVENKIKLPKLGLVRLAKSREITGRIKNAMARRNPSGRYFLSWLVETEVQELPKTSSYIGMNVGLKDFVIVSDGIIGAISISLAEPYIPWNTGVGTEISSTAKMEGTTIPVSDKINNETDLPGMLEGGKQVS